jgi:hypothetical protein
MDEIRRKTRPETTASENDDRDAGSTTTTEINKWAARFTLCGWRIKLVSTTEYNDVLA